MDDAHRHEKIAPRRTAARTVPPGKAAGCAGRIPARHDNARRAGAPLQPDGAAAQRQRGRQPMGAGPLQAGGRLELSGVAVEAAPAYNVEPERLEHFDKVYEEAAGENTAILVPAITGTGKFAVKTPDVDIKVNPDRLDLVETKFIGGRRCLVIAVEDNVEVNGMPVKMWEEQKEVQ